MKKYAIALAPVASMILAVPTFAAEAGSANSSVVSAMTSTANDMVATGSAVVPVALTVVGLALVVRFGIKIFRQVAK